MALHLIDQVVIIGYPLVAVLKIMVLIILHLPFVKCSIQLL